MYTLYGDGIHDDTPAIQEMIDSGVCEVVLPAPKVNYLITKPLVLPSDFRLVLPRYAVIRLADGSNCVMVQNKMKEEPTEKNTLSEKLWWFCHQYSSKSEDAARNIEISGGIWDFNNKGQNPNPAQTGVFEPKNYVGFGMLFYNVKGLKLSSVTLKDPVTFAVTLDTVSYFTVENITFDYNDGNPCPINMDGIHLNGSCRYGVLRNLKGACYDDLVALNAHEGSGGAITNIEIDGIFAEDCHSAVRLLAVDEAVEKITVSNIYGTFYQYAVGFTRYYHDSELRGGYFDAVTLDNICASKAEQREEYGAGNGSTPLIFVDRKAKVKNVKLTNVHRREEHLAIPTFYVLKEAVVENLILDNITTTNHTGSPIPVVMNFGEIHRLTMRNVRTDGDERLVNNGTILHLRDED